MLSTNGTFLRISVRHITEYTYDNLRYDHQYPLEYYPLDENGVMVVVPEDKIPEHIENDLKGLLEYAQAKECQLLILDFDGENHKYFPIRW